MKLIEELKVLINKTNTEQGSDTPDYILAKYLENCLFAFENAVTRRDKWYGFEPWANGPEQPKEGDTVLRPSRHPKR